MSSIPDREEQAKIEIGHTQAGPKAARVFTAFFLLVITAVPAFQAVHELTRYAAGQTREVLPSIFGVYVNAARGLLASGDARGFIGRVMDANEGLLKGIVDYENELEAESVLRNGVLPVSQQLFTGAFGLGNGKAVIGRDGWLFYEPGIRYLTMSPAQAASTVNRSSSKANTVFHEKKLSPAEAILDFHRQLQDRGIELVLVPAPVKPMFYPGLLSPRAEGPVFGRRGYLQNPLYDELARTLIKEGVLVFDAARYLHEHRVDLATPLFLQTDTHWSPGAMSLTAKGLARFLEEKVALSVSLSDRPDLHPVSVANRGDIANMLTLPESSPVMKPEEIEIQQVLTGGTDLWSADREAEVLVLGDSFANIYSQEGLGWGESSGFVEHLSSHLGAPLDRIVQNDDGAFATRKALAHELSRGRDRLAGKKVVVWEFAIRELVLGDWQPADLTLGESRPSVFFTPPEGGELKVTGTVYDVSSRPVPRSTPYKDHVMSFHLVDVEVEGHPGETFDLLVYAFSMIDYELTPAASFRPGQTMSLKIQNWFDVMGKYNSIQRTEIDNDDLLFEDPCWGSEVIQ
ncbi:MAG: hypothetical protein JXB03_03170 [Spirochaetales bacterium]|nr:hypothetical protein [Spirochaetales bacterium]